MMDSFFVRRSNKYLVALPPDLVIEQVLMASLKNCRTGLIHGRGTDELQRLTWPYSRPAYAHVRSELDKLYHYENKMIIKELTDSSIQAYTADILKILNYLEDHNHFNVKMNIW